MLQTRMLQNIDGIIFDMDGTLLDSMWIWPDVDDVYLGKYGLEKPEGFQEKMEGMSYSETAQYFLDTFPQLDRTIQEVMDEFQTSGLADQVRIRCYPSRDYPGFSYIKIYEKTVSRQAMLEELKKELGVTRVVTFGGTEEDFKTEDWKASDGNQVVKELEKLYEPLIWKKD